MTADTPLNRIDDDDYPAYTMGRAAEMLGTTPAFLRALGEARLITPLRSEGGHRRYSRYQLRIAARAREMVDQGTSIEAALPHHHPGRPARRGAAHQRGAAARWCGGVRRQAGECQYCPVVPPTRPPARACG
ncbi:hypothetical protein RKD48_003369 [Streptomyces ambofaciens]